jgi:hypothetical protein
VSSLRRPPSTAVRTSSNCGEVLILPQQWCGLHPTAGVVLISQRICRCFFRNFLFRNGVGHLTRRPPGSLLEPDGDLPALHHPALTQLCHPCDYGGGSRASASSLGVSNPSFNADTRPSWVPRVRREEGILRGKPNLSSSSARLAAQPDAHW